MNKFKNGPRKTTYKIIEFSCLPCKYLRSDLLCSGFEPIREYHCTHPEKPKGIMYGAKGQYIGRKPNTPDWCPYLLKQNKKQFNVKLS